MKPTYIKAIFLLLTSLVLTGCGHYYAPVDSVHVVKSYPSSHHIIHHKTHKKTYPAYSSYHYVEPKHHHTKLGSNKHKHSYTKPHAPKHVYHLPHKSHKPNKPYIPYSQHSHSAKGFKPQKKSRPIIINKTVHKTVHKINQPKPVKKGGHHQTREVAHPSKHAKTSYTQEQEQQEKAQKKTDRRIQQAKERYREYKEKQAERRHYRY